MNLAQPADGWRSADCKLTTAVEILVTSDQELSLLYQDADEQRTVDLMQPTAAERDRDRMLQTVVNHKLSTVDSRILGSSPGWNLTLQAADRP